MDIDAAKEDERAHTGAMYHKNRVTGIPVVFRPIAADDSFCEVPEDFLRVILRRCTFLLRLDVLPDIQVGCHILRDSRDCRHQWFQVAQWMLSLALVLFVMFVTVPWNGGKLPSAPVNAIYGGFHRLLWSVALLWPCYASATGRGGWFNSFFSWTVLRPLSRLTFCIYLTHVPMFYIRTGNMRTNFELNEFFQLSTSMGIYWFSVVFGLALHLCVEAPVSHLQKFLFERDAEKSKACADVKPSAVENGEQRSKL
ncbi:hypothetical protein HPB50_024312 [Hyalomma asiaticum]|uniref:Uncharacterized protein n=1 Tax=Hyalomma asiaticum TaxID=266040 RepID=A0ACB7TQH2_HYAAI|nr:hypothetical protein HPB50_024312 [Hyalomma asiaticum]